VKRTTLVLVVVLGLLAVGCSPALGARNDSATLYYLRLRDADGVHVGSLAPGSSGVSIDPLPDRPATVELLTEGCNVVGAWTSSSAPATSSSRFTADTAAQRRRCRGEEIRE
jgi:hypothetical protein